MTSTEMEKKTLKKIETTVGKKYEYEITDKTLGIYRVKNMDGDILAEWRARGESVMPGRVNKGEHICPSCIPGVGIDDGSDGWLDRLAQHACRMYYIMDAQEAEREGEKSA